MIRAFHSCQAIVPVEIRKRLVPRGPCSYTTGKPVSVPANPTDGQIKGDHTHKLYPPVEIINIDPAESGNSL